MDADRRVKVILSIDPIKYPLTGIGRYTLELARHLQGSERIQALRLLRGHRFVDAIPEPGTAPSSHAYLQQRLRKSRLVVSAVQFAADALKRRSLRGCEDCIFHSPNFYLPEFAGQAVATFHDLSVFRSRDCHPPERVRFMERQIALALQRASLLITDSEFTRREVAEFFAWPLERIRAIPLASSAEFQPRTTTELQLFLSQLGLAAGGYTLFSGTIEPRKNLDTLLDAYAALPLSVRQRWPLVLCGHRGWKSDALHARIEQFVREGWVRYLGYLSAADLPLVFAGARLFVFPSLYEGFGLPVLEAMASAVPVVCSDAASLPEVAGDAAALCEPLDVAALRALIEQGLQDEIWRAEAIRRGLLRAQQHAWGKCAEETIDVYADLQAAGT